MFADACQSALSDAKHMAAAYIENGKVDEEGNDVKG